MSNLIHTNIFGACRRASIVMLATVGLSLLFPSFVFALSAPHNNTSSPIVTCMTCHGGHTTVPSWWMGGYSSGDDSPINRLCWSCHNGTSTFNGEIMPMMMPHSSQQTSGTYGQWHRKCIDCHNPHIQPQSSFGTEAMVNIGVLTGFAFGLETTVNVKDTITEDYNGYMFVPNMSYPAISYKIVSSTENTKTFKVRGPVAAYFFKVGGKYGIYYGRLLSASINRKQVKFFRPEGAKSFADGDGTYDGVCEVCHTKTKHFRNNDSAPDQNHSNLGVAGSNCLVCHPHEYGFAHGGSGPCINCHGHDAGYEYESGSFSQGVGSVQSHSTHTEFDSDDQKGPGALACGTCHDTGNFPYFKTGTDANGDGKFSLAETDVCNGCHSPGGSYDGVSSTGSSIGAKNNWSIGVYTGSTLQSGKEKWCAGCHDSSPSTIAGVNAPNVIGDEAGAFIYGSGWGFYKTGHGLPSNKTYPASGGVTAGAGKGCIDCHDTSLAHADGNTRTFSGDTQDNYRIAYRLKSVGGQNPMSVPFAQNAPNNSSTFPLCYSCHTNTAPFTTTATAGTNFYRSATPQNLHNYHISDNSYRWSSDWSGSYNSRITCMSCHNVHGSKYLAMLRDGSLTANEPGVRVWYNASFVQYSTASPNPPSPENAPLAASTGIVWRGATAASLDCTTCHANNNVTPIDRAPFQNVHVAPVLDWTGEANYLSDGVNPDSAYGGSTFTFRVKYTDGDNDCSGTVKLHIDKNDNASYADPGEEVTMSAVDPLDINCTDGKLYKSDLVLAKTPDHTVSYYFSANDNADGAATGLDPVAAHLVTVGNAVPVLDWTGDTGFEDGLSPNSGREGIDTFEFRVKYTDLDNEAPNAVYVLFDMDSNGSFEAQQAMTHITGDGLYSNGESYTYSRQFPAQGTYSFKFSATDGIDSAVGNAPVTTPDSVTVTTASNLPPVLSWTGEEPAYVSDGADPDLDAGGRPFTFRVMYTDTDAPTAIDVVINTVHYPLSEGDPLDTDYSDGKIYEAQVYVEHPSTANKIETVGYSFYAKDTYDAEATAINGSLSVQNALKVPSEYATIASAITAAIADDMILVAPGTYSERPTFNGKDSFTLLGTNLPDSASPTVLTGGLNINSANGGSDNVTIKDFKVSSSGASSAFYIDSSLATVERCWFDTNTGANPVFINGSDKVTIKTSTFTNNSYPSIKANTTSCRVDVIDSVFSNNTSTDAGAIYGLNTSTWLVQGCTFESNHQTNTATGGGAIVGSTSSNWTITDSVFIGNQADGIGGGAIYCLSCSSLNIDNSSFTLNSAKAGGALYLGSSATNATITDTFIQGNSATSSSGGGAIYIVNGSHAALTNVMLTGNKAASGPGGAVFEAGYAQYNFCTISGNWATSGGGIYHQNSVTSTITNSTIYNNAPTQIYAVAPRWTYMDVYNTLINQTPGSSTNTTSYEDLGGNITDGTDPLFVNPISSTLAPTTDGDYHLQSSSACIDAGSATYPSDHDIFGGTRPLGTGYDMGVHEKQ